MEVMLPLFRFLLSLMLTGIALFLIIKDPLKFLFSVGAVGFTSVVVALMLGAPRADKKYEKLYQAAQVIAFFAVAALELYYIWF